MQIQLQIASQPANGDQFSIQGQLYEFITGELGWLPVGLPIAVGGDESETAAQTVGVVNANTIDEVTAISEGAIITLTMPDLTVNSRITSVVILPTL